MDIAAPGTNLTAAYCGGQTAGNNPTLSGSPSGPAGGPEFHSTSVAGTSFSSPITAGAVALIDSAGYNSPDLSAHPAARDARVVKAVLLNSTDKVLGWDNGQGPHPNGFGGVRTSQSLDFATGAGSLDLDGAFDQYVLGVTKDVPGTRAGNQGPVGPVGWDFGNVFNGIDNVYLISDLLSAGTDMTITLD